MTLTGSDYQPRRFPGALPPAMVLRPSGAGCSAAFFRSLFSPACAALKGGATFKLGHYLRLENLRLNRWRGSIFKILLPYRQPVEKQPHRKGDKIPRTWLAGVG